MLVFSTGGLQAFLKINIQEIVQESIIFFFCCICDESTQFFGSELLRKFGILQSQASVALMGVPAIPALARSFWSGVDKKDERAWKLEF